MEKEIKQDLLFITICIVIIGIFTYFMAMNMKDKFKGYEKPGSRVIRVVDITTRMHDEEVILIKTLDNYIMYEGSVRLLDTCYDKEEVEYVGACDDSQEPITTIILKKDKRTIDFWLSL